MEKVLPFVNNFFEEMVFLFIFKFNINGNIWPTTMGYDGPFSHFPSHVKSELANLADYRTTTVVALRHSKDLSGYT